MFETCKMRKISVARFQDIDKHTIAFQIEYAL